jgi:DNA repair exonuclease SbcCD ATPase subunit
MSDFKRTLFGYSSAGVRSALSERDAALERASKTTSEAEKRTESLSSELAETQGRVAELEEQLAAARRQLEDERTELRDARETVAGRDEQLRVAEAESARLKEHLRQQTERLDQATAEVAECRASLRAIDESGGFQAAMSAQQKRVTELEELVEGYRELIEGGTALPAAPAEPSDTQETSTAPSTAGELAAVIEVAEQAVASIMESTRVRADEELRAVDVQRERIRQDVEAMTAWRDRAAPAIVSLQGAMREMQGQAEEIGLRVDDALRPVSKALSALTSQLAALGDLAGGALDVSTEARAPWESDRVTELPKEHLASRDSSDL